MKKAIVVGATGLIGKFLVDLLAAEDDITNVIAVTRRPVTYTSDKVINEVINFDELEKYSHIFQGDILFSALGTTAKKAGTREKQRKVDYGYQLKIAEMAAKNGVRHYLLVSSGGANSSSNNAYSRMKGELDEKVVTLNFERVSIFKPSLLLGERNESRFLEGIGGVILPILGIIPGLRKYRPIKGSEVAKKMVAVCLQDGPSREAFSYSENFL